MPAEKPKKAKRRKSGRRKRPEPRLPATNNGKHPGGRPKTYHPGFPEQATRLYRLGATDAEVADFFGVTVPTIWQWQISYPEFNKAADLGKDAANARVKRALYSKAVGYSYDTEKIFQHQGKAVRVPLREHVPPSDAAIQFYLKNRLPEEFKDRHDFVELPDPVNADLRRAAMRKLMERLENDPAPQRIEMIDITPEPAAPAFPGKKKGSKP